MAKKKGKKHIDVNPDVQLAGRWIVTMESGTTYTVNADLCNPVSETLVFTASNETIFAVPNHAYTKVQKL